MAFFKFRKGEGESVAKKPTPSESVEAMRRRARQRLIGASVLVLAGVIGFPLLFDTQPRPVSVDIPIEIPDRQKAAPLSVPAETAARSEQGAAPGSAAARSEAAAAVKPVEPAPAPVAEAPAPPAPAPAPPPTAAAPAPAPAAKPEPRATAADEAARARALLEGKPVQAGDDRFVVQVGAFAEAAKAREVRSKLERAGVKTYVHVAETKDGPRIRVRVGPFTSRAEADRAVQKIKGLDLPAAVLTL